MKITEKLTNELIPYENNPRVNDDAVEYVARSIKEFGFKVPIVIDKDNVIIAGHTRAKAAKQLGIEKVPCIVANDLTPEQVKAFRLTDNKVGEIANWDFDLLESELTDIVDINMEELGFMSFENDYCNQDDSESFTDEEMEEFFEASDNSSCKENQQVNQKVKTIRCPHCGEVIEVKI